MKTIEIYTDGSCTPNPGVGTCAFIVTDSKQVLYQQGYKFPGQSTNNMMELSAVIKALEYVEKNHKDQRVYIHMDSQYVQLGLAEWLEGWKRKNWRTASKKPVANADLWQELDALKSRLSKVQFQWVKGHNNNKFNTLVDQLCATSYNNELCTV